MSAVTIAGAGAFGTALAVTQATAGRRVWLWARDAAQVAAMRETGENAKALPGVALPAGVGPVDRRAPGRGETVLLAVPTQQLRPFLLKHGTALTGCRLVACCKGVERGSGLRPSEVIAAMLPDNAVAVLTGPGFAADIARGLPTALTVAAHDPGLAEALQTELSTRTLRLYRTRDVTGAELGGALKNVIAIACGVVIGAGLGDSARAALLTRGYAEMVRLATALGAEPATLAGLSGLGDLVLTATSMQSRNFAFGHALGAGTEAAGGTVEGRATARAVADLARVHGIDMPVTDMVTALLEGRVHLAEAVEGLLSRPLKEED